MEIQDIQDVDENSDSVQARDAYEQYLNNNSLIDGDGSDYGDGSD